MDNNIKYVKRDELKEIIETNKSIILVDYYGKSCACCETTESELSKLKIDIPIYKVMINSQDEANEIKSICGSIIESTPTCCLYRDGKEIHKFVGNCRAEEYELIIQTL